MQSPLFHEVPQILADLEYEIGRHGLDCADNFRAAIRGDIESEKGYFKIRANGCCGSFDTTTKFDGVTYLIGCNYGH